MVTIAYLDWIEKNNSRYLSKVSLAHSVWVDKFTQPDYLKGYVYNRGSSARVETFASITEMFQLIIEVL